ncbi:hypothetical protein Abr02nite_80990 [Paractinoplanes brasiliensis]|nr:hypothetical protein Abr02nite_80990 [Actinoplanes brasiliensis]
MILAISIGLVTGSAGAAVAAAPTKAEVLASWTQTSAASYASWNSARQNQQDWAQYSFDWSTDYCTTSPDNPLGFNFELACYRHDFGYRNYRAAGQFDANKDRVDSAFYQDLQRSCDTYGSVVRPACDALAWTYYQAVRIFGFLVVTDADIERAKRIKEASERQAANR